MSGRCLSLSIQTVGTVRRRSHGWCRSGSWQPGNEEGDERRDVVGGAALERDAELS